MIPWTNKVVTTLAPNEVFVFGSNEQGFHGAGAAGLAFRGDARNTWRTDPAFIRAFGSLPESTDRVGRWAVYGIARGYQVGREGRSYAIATVTRPGARRSISRREIYAQLVTLWDFVKDTPNITYLIPPLGEGYAGYTPAEMNTVWEYLIQKHGLPENVRFVGRTAVANLT